MAYDPNYSTNVGGFKLAYGPNGEQLMQLTSAVGFATLAAAKAATFGDGQLVLVTGDGSLWRYAATSVITGDDVLVATMTTGRLIRVDKSLDITAAVTSATADATVLYTVPTGFRLQVDIPFWSVSVTFTTGTAATAKVKSSNAGLSTAGDLLGGASGDVVATLVSTGAYAKGTVGAKINTPACVLSAGDTVIFNLGNTFTAGTGLFHMPVSVLLAPAA